MTVAPAIAAATLRRRAEQRRAEAASRTAELRRRLPAAAELLRTRFGATDIWLFGSVAQDRAHAASDVDLAVPHRIPDYFRALVELEEILGVPVDLVELDTAAPSLVARVHRDGISL